MRKPNKKERQACDFKVENRGSKNQATFFLLSKKKSFTNKFPIFFHHDFRLDITSLFVFF